MRTLKADIFSWYILVKCSGGHFEGRPKKRGVLDRFKNKYQKDTQEMNG